MRTFIGTATFQGFSQAFVWILPFCLSFLPRFVMIGHCYLCLPFPHQHERKWRRRQPVFKHNSCNSVANIVVVGLQSKGHSPDSTSCWQPPSDWAATAQLEEKALLVGGRWSGSLPPKAAKFILISKLVASRSSSLGTNCRKHTHALRKQATPRHRSLLKFFFSFLDWRTARQASISYFRGHKSRPSSFCFLITTPSAVKSALPEEENEHLFLLSSCERISCHFQFDLERRTLALATGRKKVVASLVSLQFSVGRG